MVETVQPLKELNELEQAALFHTRESTRGRRDPTKELFRTALLGVQDAAVDTGAFFPDRDRPVTFATEIETSGATPSGNIFEFGDSTSGIQLGLNDDTLSFAAGNGAAGTDGIDDSIIVPSLAIVGARHHLVVAVNPGQGKGRVWINGILALRVQNDPAVALLNGVWASNAMGAIADAQNGTSNLRVTDNAAPSNFALVKPFTVFMGQVPRQFD